MQHGFDSFHLIGLQKFKGPLDLVRGHKVKISIVARTKTLGHYDEGVLLENGSVEFHKIKHQTLVS